MAQFHKGWRALVQMAAWLLMCFAFLAWQGQAFAAGSAPPKTSAPSPEFIGPAPPPVETPTLGAWGLLIAGGGLLVVGLYAAKRRVAQGS